MKIPKKIHYFWVGSKISEKDLRRIIAIKSENPGFEVNIWGLKNVKSLILNRLININFKYNDVVLDIGELFGNQFVYRDIETAFNFLINHSSSLIDTDFTRDLYEKKRAELTNLGVRYNNDSTRMSFLHRIFHPTSSGVRSNDYSKVIRFLHHIFHLQLHGDFKNYASASDIARLVILYMEGGIYLDVDVELTDSDIKYMQSYCFGQNLPIEKRFNRRARFEKLELKSDIGFGDCHGMGWGRVSQSDEKWNIRYLDACRIKKLVYNEFSNGIIAAQPRSEKIMALLVFIACNIKKYTYNQEDKTLSSKWRTGIVPHLPSMNTPSYRRCRRLDLTVDMTGPQSYQELFSIVKNKELDNQHEIDFISPPRNWQMNSGLDLMFKKVDTKADWATVKNKK
ncbi:TcdA/TcdB catalytic glycosyltransferase domain-containing protein [Xenorhabdus sp. PB62.4]|uniref:TcdA/TcdB catalytic glycosyltransferase domain-containing protein n=1 Tax=Xenorhabdus sp. PB62.4 TaxID=1851573 RepID=UPI0021021FB1|nr:TcdA/TcdB catalytic glycosyltransferase domain-containing protein [Xenorhabdus sp. PB62.4]MBC8953384.1 hypothetical protein [Xenorhabdus sp. PB62.4]